MSEIVLAVIAAETAKLARSVPAPPEPLGYGVDLVCADDVTPQLDEEDPTTPASIGRGTYRRLITPRGGNPDDPDYGRDVRGMVNRGMTAADLRAEAGQIKLEVEKDDRIDDAAVTLALSDGGRRVRVTLRITPADPELVPFDLVLVVSDGGELFATLNGRAI